LLICRIANHAQGRQKEFNVQQLSSLITVFMILAIVSARFATAATNNEHWGGTIGALFIGPIIVFFVVHTILYFTLRLLRGKDGVASYTGSKINCLSALMTILTAVAVA
jgi:predicted Na+-dependent transporter